MTEQRRHEEEAWYRQQQLLVDAEQQRREMIAIEERKLLEQRKRLVFYKCKNGIQCSIHDTVFFIVTKGIYIYTVHSFYSLYLDSSDVRYIRYFLSLLLHRTYHNTIYITI